MRSSDAGEIHVDGFFINAMVSSIAGQHLDYLVKQLIVFQRTDERPGGVIMKAIAHDLSGDDIDNVAAYLQAMPNK